MKLQKQTLFGGADAPPHERGNCFATCIASLIGFDVSDVPNFVANGGDWFADTINWLNDIGLGIISFNSDPSDIGHYKDAILIASGPGPRGHRHSVLWQGGKLFWDPHPSNSGLLRADEWEVLIVNDFIKWSYLK